jgi:hypothetical protein
MAAVQTYFQADEPTDSAPGTIWLRSDGTKAQRDLSSAWVEKGNWLLEDDGLLSQEGGSVQGPITGNHGHAPTDSPAFTTVITLDGEEVPDKPWVTEQLANMQTDLQNYITEALSGGDSGVSIGNNLAFGYGQGLTNGSVVPLPKYADDTRATIGEVVLLMVAAGNNSFSCNVNAQHNIYVSVDPATLIVTCYGVRLGTGNTWNGVASYFIVCQR